MHCTLFTKTEYTHRCTVQLEGKCPHALGSPHGSYNLQRCSSRERQCTELCPNSFVTLDTSTHAKPLLKVYGPMLSPLELAQFVVAAQLPNRTAFPAVAGWAFGTDCQRAL